MCALCDAAGCCNGENSARQLFVFLPILTLISNPYPLFLTQKRIDDEIQQLLVDIRRIGEPGSPEVKFGDLFDDDDAQQYYEALVGTLKSAKKRGVIDFKGQMLLKGMHDNVVISIKNGAATPVEAN